MQTSGEPPIANIPDALLGWYDVNARRLPWRHMPDDPPADPYRVWLSEVMLQQTTVAAVRAYYKKFLDLWPTVEDLAAADDANVMAAWAGLGYYARARNLLACAREVARLGGFPRTEEGLRTLPGLGAYTAAAVAAIAFGQRAVVVDANVERVVSRLFAIAEPLPAGRSAIRAATETITPDRRAGDFAQAMMDLGSSICTVRSPAACCARSRQTARPEQTARPRTFRSRPRRRRSPCGRAGPTGSSAAARWCSSRARPRACWAGCARCQMMAGPPALMATPRRRSRANGAKAASFATVSRISISNCN